MARKGESGVAAVSALFRSSAVTTILSGLIVYVVTHFQALLTDAVLSWVLIGAGAVIVSLAFSWGFTQAWKFFCVDVSLTQPPDTTAMKTVAEMAAARAAWDLQVRHARRGIYACAMICCVVPSLGLGAILLLFNLTHITLLVYGVVWCIASLTLSAASPWLWKMFFIVFIPWMLAQEKKA